MIAPTRKFSHVDTPCRTDLTVRQAGMTLVETMVALSVLSLVLVASGLALSSGMQQRRESHRDYLAMSALRDAVAEIQRLANLPNDLIEKTGIGAVYGAYHQSSVAIDELPDGRMNFVCFASEPTVPAVLGGPQDLNFDSDAQDNLGNESVGTDLRLVPIQLTALYTEGESQRTVTIHRLITRTSN